MGFARESVGMVLALENPMSEDTRHMLYVLAAIALALFLTYLELNMTEQERKALEDMAAAMLGPRK